MPVHLHSGISASHLQQRIVQASVPAACVIAWQRGFWLLNMPTENNVPGWPDWLLGDYLDALTSIQPESPLTCLLVGAIHLTPSIIGLCLIGWCWSLLFARLRQRATDPVWLMTGWLLALLAPAATTFGLLAIACSFGIVFGALMFGGSGRYVVSPALLAAVFLQFNDPQQQTVWLTHAVSAQTLAAQNPEVTAGVALSPAYSIIWTIACALGAWWLVRNQTISWRALTGGITAALLTGWLLASTDTQATVLAPWYSHLALGGAAFMLVFVVSDPACAPHTPSGRWALGIAFGTLLVVLRTVDSAHPEASTTAALLAMLLIPLVDHIHVGHRRRQTLASRPPHRAGAS